MAKKSWVYVYCDKCGFITTEDPYNSNSEKICTVCKNILKRVPKKYHTKSTKYEFMYSNEFEILRKELVLTSPNFDQYYYECRKDVENMDHYNGSESNVLVYCDRCGHIKSVDICGEEMFETRRVCPVCRNILRRVPRDYRNAREGKSMTEEDKQRVLEELILPSPNFNQYHFDRRDDVINERHAAVSAAMARDDNSSCGPKCPFCGSTSISPISAVSRAISVGMLGFASGKIGKTHKCNSCGSMW